MSGNGKTETETILTDAIMETETKTETTTEIEDGAMSRKHDFLQR